ncbi:MAG: 4-alpha-glucanotransferase [Methylococcales bacterium]|nr:4-alpha-glucanotransferase [Methylococcales bacterium]MDD5755518.1 4-alpha-glucanotransferase [Methylococcales bacterium]
MKATLNQRRAGVLLHITSLPGRDLGRDAYQFVDFLREAGASVWQVLPLGITHEDGSPYQSLSAHAGNPALISPHSLVTDGWLEAEEHCDTCSNHSELHRACLLSKAFTGFKARASETEKADFLHFCETSHFWLDDFALFMVLRQKFNNQGWNDWADDFKNRNLAALNDVRFFLKTSLETVKFEQYIFFKQWTALKTYANEHGVLLFGDMPIFVSYDSADVWANRKVFKLTPEGNMSVVAGVPPDYFSKTGQRWGNPHYDWDYLQATGFTWWLQRMKTQTALFDIVRIDHFRGLEAAWEIPAEEPNAIKGAWVKAAGAALLTTIHTEFSNLKLVAEDLGIITPEVDALRSQFNLPGMKIMQFAFSGDADNPYLPENHKINSVVYTGTHDNDTTIGWVQKLTLEEREFVCKTLAIDDDADIAVELMKCALASIANLAILPMQDILELDSTHRMNTPGTIGENWQWHFQWKQLTDEKLSQFSRWIERSNR